MSGISEILPGRLYISRGISPGKARLHGMRYVLNVARRRYGSGQVRHFPLRDGREDPAKLLEAALKIKRRLDGGRVPLLVHCAAGKSRSVTAVGLYLVISGRVRTLGEAIRFVKKKRPIANPNERILASGRKALKLWRGKAEQMMPSFQLAKKCNVRRAN